MSKEANTDTSLIKDVFETDQVVPFNQSQAPVESKGITDPLSQKQRAKMNELADRANKEANPNYLEDMRKERAELEAIDKKWQSKKDMTAEESARLDTGVAPVESKTKAVEVVRSSQKPAKLKPTLQDALAGKSTVLGESSARKKSQEIEKLKSEGKITPTDENYWSVPIKGEPKAPVPKQLDSNGVQVKEGDTIEFGALLDGNKKGTTTVQWLEPYIANASGKRVEGSWIGNGALPSRIPFTIINRADGTKLTKSRPTPKVPVAKPAQSKPTLQDALEGKSTKIKNQATKTQVQPRESQQTKSAQVKDTPTPRAKQSLETTERINRPLQDISKDSPVNVDEFISEQVKLQDTKVKKTGRIADAKRKWVDSLAPAEDNFRQAVADGKLSQETLDDIIVKNGQSLRSGTIANLNLQESGLVELLHGMSKSDYDNFGQVITAIHSNDLRANNVETGRSPQVDSEIISKYGKQFEGEIKQFRESADYVLNKAVEHQLISKDTAKLLKKKYPNYVPMNRVIAEIENSGSFNSSQIASIGAQTVVRKIKGSKRAVQNPVESMIAKVQDMSRQGMRNEASLAWVDALKETGGAKRVDGTVKPGESTISVIRNGNKEIYSVDSEIEAAAKGLTKEQMNVAVETMRKISRVFKTGTTGLNLPFTVTNLARDQQAAFLNMQKGEVAAFKAMPKALMETLGHGDVYQEAVRNGAISTSYDLTKDPTFKNFKDADKKARYEKRVATKLRKRGSKMGVFDRIEDAVGRSEEYTRLQQYMGTKDYWLNKGLSESEAQTKATIAAQQNSADFARAGDFGRVLNAVLPYTNASVQGTRAYLRSAKANPKRYALKATATLGVPMAMVAAWNYADDDREEVLNDISEFDKQANFIIVTPWAKKNDEGKWEGIVKVPKPPGIAALTYPIEQTIAWSKGNDPVAFEDITQALLGFASPLGDNTKAAVSTITPQALKPAIETTFNTNLFTGRDIVPFYMKDKPTDEQAFEGTSGTARGIGSAVGTSPLNIEHLIKGYGGEVGLQGLNLVDNALNKAGVIPEEQIGGRSIPYGFSRRFTEGYADFDSTIPKGTNLKDTKESVGSLKTKGDFVSISDKSEKDKSGDFVSRSKYDAIINAYSKNEKTTNGTTTSLGNIDKYDSNELRNAIKEVSGEAKKMFTDAGLDTGAIKFNSNLATEYAKYKKKLEGSNQIEKDKARESFLRTAYNSQLDEVERDLYSLSEDDLFGYIDRGVLSEENLTRALAVEKQLFNAGLISKETLARKMGTTARGYKTSKSSGRGGSKKSSFKYSMFPGGSNSFSSTNKSLRAILNQAVVS